MIILFKYWFIINSNYANLNNSEFSHNIEYYNIFTWLYPDQLCWFQILIITFISKINLHIGLKVGITIVWKCIILYFIIIILTKFVGCFYELEVY